MKLLVTGGTGFIGRNIVPQLRLRYDVTLCGRSESNDVRADLSLEVPILSDRYDVVFHAAGKAHVVPASAQEEKAFYDTNFEGTKNLCAALEKAGLPESFIFLSTVAVYGCTEGENIDENHALDASQPYGLSKLRAERYLAEWCSKNGVRLTILRAPLIAGPNPPGNLGAMIAGIKSGRYLSIGGGKAHKSILMVNDLPALIDAAVNSPGVYNVCADYSPTFGELEECIAGRLGRRVVSIPIGLARFCAMIGNIIGPKAPLNSDRLSKITKSLTFSNARARRELGWTPTEVLTAFKVD